MIDLQTILSTVVAGLLLAILVGGFVLRDNVTKLTAEFRAFRHEVLRFMDAHEPRQGD